MKYHSLKWWFYAIREQIKDFIRNTICRKLLKIQFGYMMPDLLSIFVIDNKFLIYDTIIRKYPELKNLRKYTKTEQVITVTEFLCGGIFLRTNKMISTFWSQEGKLEDLNYLLSLNIPINVTIRNTLDCLHEVLIVGSDEQHIIFNDPLGDPFFKYKVFYGYNISYKKEKFLKAAGENLKLSFMVDNGKKEIIEKIKQQFTNRKLYSLEADDFTYGALLDKNNFTFSYYSEDGKLNLSMDLGECAKKKFIMGYGEFSKTDNTLWPPEEKTIMNIVFQYHVLNKLKLLKTKFE